LDDNCGLYHALKDNLPVLPVFIFDTEILDKLMDRRDTRVEFIHKQVGQLAHEFQKYGSGIEVFYGKPIEAFRTFTKKFNVKKVFTNCDYEPYTKKRDVEISDLLKLSNIEFHTYKDQVIFEALEIAKEDGDPYKVYTPYKEQWLKKNNQLGIAHYPSQTLLSNLFKTKTTTLPDLKAIGFKHTDMPIPETTIDKKIISEYDKQRNYPAKNGTSRLGIHLRHGTISIRKAVDIASQYNKIWLQELIWREFYMMILDNFPRVVDEEFNLKYKKFPWKYDEENFKKWCKGKTGYPIVDAGMRELNQTGHMHNRVRMITASFLTKHLLIDWRWGEAYFAGKLLDYELASNNGGWQWAAGCGTDAQPYFRIFNPAEQAKKFDPKGEYVRKWVPELNSFHYPNPIIDHKFARQRAIETFKTALQG